LRRPDPDDAIAPRIDNVSTRELGVALPVDPNEPLKDEALPVKDSICRIGGRENAMWTTESLATIERELR
jgi:hypothetical protein